eukprot:1195556-Prorocentrum_minimum.AAC.4
MCRTRSRAWCGLEAERGVVPAGGGARVCGGAEHFRGALCLWAGRAAGLRTGGPLEPAGSRAGLPQRAADRQLVPAAAARAGGPGRQEGRCGAGSNKQS